MTIPNIDGSIDYEGEGLTWLNVIFSIHQESAGAEWGRDIAEEWSIQCHKHNDKGEDRFSITWNSCKDDHPNPRTARSLVMWAREFNPDLWLASEVAAVDAALGDAVDAAPGKPASTKGVEIYTGENITMEAVEWIWPGYLARGKFHVLGGQKGTGKTTITLSFTAKITTGGKWPNGAQAPLGNVLIWSGEDDMSDTIMPRIAAMGGDIKRVHFVKSITDQGKKRRFGPATDLPRLVEAMRAVPDLRMVIIDPIVSASKNDSHKNAETRRGLQPVVDLAEELRVVVIGLTHFTKNTQGKDPIERITGTLAFGALPRVVFGAAMSKDADAIRRFVRIASNIGPSGGGFEYALDQKIVPGHDFTNQIVKWSGTPLVGSAIDLIGNIESPQSQKLMAGEFLTQMLTDAGAAGVDVPDLKKAAEANGLTWITVIRAKNDLGNISAKKREGIAHGAWYWLIGNDYGYDDEPL